MSFTTRDATPPYVPLDPGGVIVPAGAEVEVVPALAGRTSVIVVNTGDDVVWLGLGQTAQVDVGLPLWGRGFIDYPLNCAIRVRNPSADDVLVTWQGFGL